MTAGKQLYIVQVKKHKRWVTTIWTGYIPATKRSKKEVDDETGLPLSYTGKPVSMPAAKKALATAQGRFPKSEFRIREISS